MLETFSLFVAWVVTFLNIVGVSIPQWVKRKDEHPKHDFGGRRQVGLLEYPSEYSEWVTFKLLAAILELLAIFCMTIACILLFLKVCMDKDDKRFHFGAAGLSAFSGMLMIAGPYVFYADPGAGFNFADEKMGNGVSLCIEAGVLAIGNAILLAIEYCRKR